MWNSFSYFFMHYFVLLSEARPPLYLYIFPAPGAEECESYMSCSHVHDPVCGITINKHGFDIRTYDNICHLRQSQCLSEDEGIHQASDKWCNIERPAPTRRVTDFSIVGAHEVCNHTCPTHCPDTYEPACAQIWKNIEKTKSYYRAMVNHCHVDLFSCAFGVNVTILAISKCHKEPSKLLFLTQIAAMKSLRLLQ